MSIQTNNAPKADAGKQRKLIRKKVAELLKGKTDAGDRVFPNATIPTWEEELPAILVYTRSEPVTPYAETPRELERNLDIIIEIKAKGPETDEEGEAPLDGESLEDILDDISEQVEAIMSVDDSLEDTADESILQNTELDYEGTGALPIGAARLSYNITYYTMSPRQGAALNNLGKVEAQYHVGKVDEKTREAKDTIAIPEN